MTYQPELTSFTPFNSLQNKVCCHVSALAIFIVIIQETDSKLNLKMCHCVYPVKKRASSPKLD